MITEEQWRKWTLREVIKEIKEGHLSPEALLEESIRRVEADEKLPDKLNAVISLHREQALEQIKALGSKLKETPLAGVPLVIKANMHLRGYPVHACSRILKGYISPYTGGVGTKLLDHGASIMAVANMDEFAMGSSNETSAFGFARNPIHRDYTPGGSSGGSAAAVGGAQVLAAFGSDTGGSIRQPTACCGVVGLKPTYGRVSRYGVVAFGSSFDQIGPITRSCEDSALLFDIISGHDERDATTLRLPPAKCVESLENSLKGKRIALPEQFFGEGVDPDIVRAMEKVIDFYKGCGVIFEKISLKYTDYSTAIYYVLSTAELTSNLSRIDGVRYGRRSQSAKSILEVYEKSRDEGFNKESKRRILMGNYVLSGNSFSGYYATTKRLRSQLQKEYMDVFNQFDMILVPTLPYKIFKLQERIEDPMVMYLSDVFTVAANVVGLPALSLPCDKDEVGLPISFQLMARPCREDVILSAGHHYEKENRKVFFPEAQVDV